MREISTVRSESVRLIENARVSREMRETWQVCMHSCKVHLCVVMIPHKCHQKSFFST